MKEPRWRKKEDGSEMFICTECGNKIQEQSKSDRARPMSDIDKDNKRTKNKVKDFGNYKLADYIIF